MIEVEYIDHMGSDLSTVNSARVSFSKRKDEMDTGDERLIKYLGEHDHISPFGHAFACFRIKAPVFVARQLVKHKFLRWNEESRRYVNHEPEFFLPDGWRKKAEDKKQGSSDELITIIESKAPFCTPSHPDELVRLFYEDALEMYNHLLLEGVCEEQARMVLPQGMMTEWYWSGSLDAFASMCNLRCKPDAQLETRLVADEIDKKMAELFPHSWDALRK